MRGPGAVATLAVLAVATACFSGRHDEESAGDGSSDDGAGSGSDGGGEGDDGQGAEACGADVPAIDMRRLTHVEYANSIVDLLGEGLPDPTASFPPEAVVQGFDNNREAVGISDVLVERYRDAAEAIAEAVLADPSRRAAVVGCEEETTACIEAFARAFGRRAYRRPLDDDEVAALVALSGAQGPDAGPLAGTRAVLEAILQSPSFLYRIEIGTPDPGDPGRLRLSGHEVATRLSYLLLASTPPDALLDAADAGDLDDADGVEAAALALLEDPRAPARLEAFYAQWLDLRGVADLARDPAEFPAWSDALKASMREEADRLLQAHLFSGGDLLDMLVTDTTWVDAELGALYGVAAPAEGWAEVELDADGERGGLLGLAAILAVTGRAGVTTPIVRGRFIRESLLCDTLPPPPPDVPLVPDPMPGESDRDRLARHRSDPACAGCHDLLEPLGYGLARFDAIGAHQPVDIDGRPISAEGSFDGSDEPDFDGARALQAALASDPAVASCVVRHLHRYAFGKSEDEADACTIEGLDAAFTGGDRSFTALVVALVRSDAFRYRHGEGS